MPRAALVLSTSVFACLCSAQGIRVELDGQRANFNDAQPQMIGGMVYVPIRGVFEQMGATIDWDSDQRMVTGHRGSHHMTMRAEGHSAMVDNRAVRLDGRARIIGGSIMVPLRFVSEALGSQVDWNDTTQTVNIRSEDGHFMSKAVRPLKNRRDDGRGKNDQRRGGG